MKHVNIILCVIEGKRAVAEAWQDFRGASRHRFFNQLCGLQDPLVFLSANDDAQLSGTVPEALFERIARVRFQERDHIRFFDLARIPIVIAEQGRLDA